VRVLLPGAALLIATLVAAAAPAQPPPVKDNRLFQSGIEITSVTATVTDHEGQLVTGLEREAFEVFEDGIRQTVTQFTRERVAVGLGVLLDNSDSMFGRRIQDARAAVNRFLFELLEPVDEFFVMAFNHKPRPMTGWTRAQQDVQRALDGLKPNGGTAIYDTIVDALPMLDVRTRPRGALVVISDGADTASNIGLRELRSALLRTDGFVYAIAIDPPERQAINTRVNAQALREITAETGGRTEVVQNTSQLLEATARIAEELNNQYVLGYTSPRGADGQYHSIRVRVAGTGYRVRARNGYVATPLPRRRPSTRRN
jgi:Ca-activated chloride channel family protein